MRHLSDIIRRVVPAVLIAFAFTTTIARADAPSCASGLMRRDEAASGTLLLKTRTPGCYLGAPRVAADIRVNVAGPVARARVTQRFHNPSGSWVEGVYLFPLPDGAAVDTLKLRVGNRLIEGQVKEKQEARQIYEEAKANGRRASLVEEDRPNTFTNQVANIGPHETVTVQIEYQESLRFDHGKYRLRVPLVVAPRYVPDAKLVKDGDNVSVADPVPDRDKLTAPVLPPASGKVNPVRIRVNLETGFPLGDVESASHQIALSRHGGSSAEVTLADGKVPADRDFTLSFAAAPGAAPRASLLKETVDGQDYLLALVVPPAAQKPAVLKPREVVFVLDNSGSMGGESIRQAKASLLLALDRLKPWDRFNVIRFDDTLTVLHPASVEASRANIDGAKLYVDGIDAAGGTEMLPALKAALDDPTPDDKGVVRQVVFLTDGDVANEAELFAAIKTRIGRSRLFTVGIGSAPNMYFMSGAARNGRGTYTGIASIDEVGPRMAELFAKLERPVMTDLKASWPQSGVTETWPNPLPDLYDGEPVVITAKATNLQGELKLSGNFGDTPWTTRLRLADARPAAGIEKLWARNRIASLEDSRVLGVDAASVDGAVLRTALDHHLTSRLTSLVAVDLQQHRPGGAPLSRQDVPLNLPAGWDFDKVFGTDMPNDADIQHAENVPANLLRELDGRQGENAVRPDDAPVTLPQGGTDSRLMFILGLGLLLLASLALRQNKAEPRQ